MEQKPQIPTLKDSRKTQVKIKGLASGLPLIERLKQFKKKDLAFILAGLGVLFMAPLAEHFMMSPENADSSTFKPGWGFQPSGRFGDGGSPYEGGVNGLAPGGVAGGGGDVITPLNVRDPSALVMGPAAQQQPAATATTTPPVKEATDWKDALANAAAKGAAGAAKAASLPVPKASLTNAGLRGLGAASGGGGGGGYVLPPISAANVPNKAAESNSLQRVAKAPGYLGAGARGSQNASAQAMEALKKAAANAGGDFNRQGPAAAALEAAASRNMPSGGSSGDAGGGGSGSSDKTPGGNQDKGSKSMGESLDFLAQKDWQQKMRDLKYELMKKDAMLWPNLKEKIAEELVMSPLKGMTGQMTDMFKDWGGDASGKKWRCDQKDISESDVGSCGDPPDTIKKKSYVTDGRGNIWYTSSSNFCSGPGQLTNCKLSGSDSGGSSGGQTENGVPGVPGATMDLPAICASLDQATSKGIADFSDERAAMKTAAQSLVMIRDTSKGSQTGDCGAAWPGTAWDKTDNIDSLLKAFGAALGGQAGQDDKGGLSYVLEKALKADAGALDAVKVDADQAADVQTPGQQIAQAKESYDADYKSTLASANDDKKKSDAAMKFVGEQMSIVNENLGKAALVQDSQKLDDQAKAHYKSLSAFRDRYAAVTGRQNSVLASLSGSLGQIDGKDPQGLHKDVSSILRNSKGVVTNTTQVTLQPVNGVADMNGDAMTVPQFNKALEDWQSATDQIVKEQKKQKLEEVRSAVKSTLDYVRNKQNGAQTQAVFKNVSNVETTVKSNLSQLP